MSQSRLIELSYYDPGTEVRLTAYADTLVLDERRGERTMTAIRFGGYPEMVNAMAAAIHGGAAIDGVVVVKIYTSIGQRIEPQTAARQRCTFFCD